MSVFQRKINIGQLNEQNIKALPWLGDLFRHWAPAGSGARSGADHALRFAIRDGYANFYVDGQSVAKVTMGPKTVSASVHRKYLEQDKLTRDGLGQKTVTFNAYRSPDQTQGGVADWIQIAARYAGAEKSFVERLVAANPNVIDMEMALSTLSKKEPGKKIAIRMDLVALEPDAAGWKLVFWEAKMADNPDARSKGKPAVTGQHENYKEWLTQGNQHNKDLVIDAYQSVCRQLVEVHRIVAELGLGRDLPGLGDGIIAVAGGAALTVDDDIRLIVDNSINDASFEDKGHRAKLEREGLFVQVVPENGEHRLGRRDA
jgi:hypothetical protein